MGTSNFKNTFKKTSVRNYIFNTILTIGIVIGVGIFFKNKSIIAAAHGDTTIIISGWVFGAVISLSSAIAFSLLSFKIKNSDNNTAEFIEVAFGKKASNFTKWANVLVYFPIYIYAISLFANIQLLDLFGFSTTNISYPIILFSTTTFSIALFIAINFFASKISRMIHISSTIIKLLPFIILAIIAISTIFSKNEHAYWNGHPQVDPKTLNPSSFNQTSSMSSIAIVFWIIPAVKFAFDGFVAITSNKKNSTPKSLAWGITTGMIIISILFILTTVAVLKEGVSSVPEAIVSFLGGDIHNLSVGYLVIDKIVTLIIVISGLGAMNGMILLWKRNATQVCLDYKQTSNKKVGFVLTGGILFSVIPWVILTIVIVSGHAGKIGAEGTDVFDEVSNIVLLLSFSLNALIFLKFIIFKFKKKIELSWVFVLSASIAIIGIGATALWKIIDHLIVDIALHGTNIGIFGWQKWTYVPVFLFVVAQVATAAYIGKKIILR